MRLAETFGRQDIGVDTLRPKIRHDVIRPTRRQIDVVRDARPLQCRSDRQVVGKSVHDNLGILQRPQLRDILVERRFALRAELVEQAAQLQQVQAQAAAQQAEIVKMQAENKWVVAGDLLFPEGGWPGVSARCHTRPRRT